MRRSASLVLVLLPFGTALHRAGDADRSNTVDQVTPGAVDGGRPAGY